MEKKQSKCGGRAALAAFALAGVLTVGGTVAYLVDQSNPVENVFSSTEVTCEVVETFDESGKKDVQIQNTGDIPAYIRAAVVINWVDSQGRVVPSVPDGYSYAMTGNLPAGSGWLAGADGYFYYASPVAAFDNDPATSADMTANLIDSITVTAPQSPEYFLSVDILASAIQAEPSSVVQGKWKVALDANGDIAMSAGGSALE